MKNVSQPTVNHEPDNLSSYDISMSVPAPPSTHVDNTGHGIQGTQRNSLSRLFSDSLQQCIQPLLPDRFCISRSFPGSRSMPHTYGNRDSLLMQSPAPQ